MSASKTDVDPVGCWVNATYRRDDAVGQWLARREANQVDGAVPVAVESLVAVLRAVREWSTRGASGQRRAVGACACGTHRDHAIAGLRVAGARERRRKLLLEELGAKPGVSRVAEPAGQPFVTIACNLGAVRLLGHVGQVRPVPRRSKAGEHCSNPGKGGRAAYAFDGATGPPRAGGGTACCRSAATAAGAAPAPAAAA